MEQIQPQSIETSNKSLKRKWPLFVMVILFMITSFVAGYGSGFVMGQKKSSNNYLPQQIDSSVWENSKSISGTISNISGNTLSVTNIVRSISTPPDQKNSEVFQVEITSDTKISKITGPIEPGKLLPKTAEISVGALEAGMIVKIESAEPISSSSLKAMSIEAQPGVPTQQTNTVPSYVPPLTPLDLPTASQSADTETN